MNFLLHHIDTIIGDFDGTLPLSVYLKNYYRTNRQLGSRDRKAIAEGVYLYYRYARRMPPDSAIFTVIRNALRHAGTRNAFLETMILREFPDLPELSLKPAVQDNYPALSEGISWEEWDQHFLVQPDMFIRIRNSTVPITLDSEQIEFDADATLSNCLRIPNQTDLSRVLPADSYVVQDRSSQQSMHILLDAIKNGKILTAWDCCAGAGGKSLMLRDSRPEIQLLASDIRQSILENLKDRFRAYRLDVPRVKVLDLTQKQDLQSSIGAARFDLILCDVPCTGSGTWARTPEQYHFFNPVLLSSVSERQLGIASNALTYLKKGGYFAYITCSVFREENEIVADKLMEEFPLEVITQQLVNGVPHKADSLFITVFRKSSDS